MRKLGWGRWGSSVGYESSPNYVDVIPNFINIMIIYHHLV